MVGGAQIGEAISGWGSYWKLHVVSMGGLKLENLVKFTVGGAQIYYD